MWRKELKGAELLAVKGDGARALTAVPSKIHALLGDFILLVGELERARSGTLWRRRAESAVVLTFQEEVTWGGNRDSTQAKGQVGRLIRRGSPREPSILTGTWFYRDWFPWTAGESGFSLSEPLGFARTAGARKLWENTVGG